MTSPISAERARLARSISKAEKDLDKAMNLLGKSQRALVDVGESISGMHLALLEMKKALAAATDGDEEDTGTPSSGA